MPELRKDPVSGRWIIISTERGKRPSEFRGETPARRNNGGFCPFCPGNEDKTPREVLSYRRDGSPPDTPGWELRVVPNRYPALRIEGGLNRQGEGIYDKMNGIGAHEVIIETPSHEATLATLAERDIENVFWSFHDRVLDLKKDRRFKYILIFKNHGEAAGASVEHTHSQLIALPIVPKRVREEIDGCKTYYSFKERCIYCDIIKQESDVGTRVIAENSDFLAVSPFAPRFPFETWILPKNHGAYFEACQKHEYENLSKVVKDILMRMDRVLEFPPYNMLIQTSPFHEIVTDFYHWHIEIMPKLTKVAGFEWGTGFYLNPTLPEEAAKFMREAAP
ncbi:MAG: galactose-1-phosphate uridylyltransferase [Acidobacteriota bacterium]